MTVFSGRRASSPPSSTWRLFVLQGELPEETFLTEVAPAFTSLRARGVFLLLSPAGRIFLWLGSCSSPHQAAAGRERAAAWLRAAPSELGASPLEVEVVEQGAEPALFWEGVGGREGGRFPPGCARLEATARLFHCSSVLGEFQALEIRPDWINTGTACQLLHSQVPPLVLVPVLALTALTLSLYLSLGTPIHCRAAGSLHVRLRHCALPLAGWCTVLN